MLLPFVFMFFCFYTVSIFFLSTLFLLCSFHRWPFCFVGQRARERCVEFCVTAALWGNGFHPFLFAPNVAMQPWAPWATVRQTPPLSIYLLAGSQLHDPNWSTAIHPFFSLKNSKIKTKKGINIWGPLAWLSKRNNIFLETHSPPPPCGIVNDKKMNQKKANCVLRAGRRDTDRQPLSSTIIPLGCPSVGHRYLYLPCFYSLQKHLKLFGFWFWFLFCFVFAVFIMIVVAVMVTLLYTWE